MTQEEIDEQERIEYYAASVTAWFNSSLEYSKSILTLSAGGIGILITLITTFGLDSAEALVLHCFAIICFLIALISTLIVFQQNKTYIEEIQSGKNTSNDPVLSILDVIVLWAFGLGVVFTAIIGISTAIHSYTTKEKIMANETRSKVGTMDSFNRAAALQPATRATNSQPQTDSSSTGASTTTSSSTKTGNTNTQNQSVEKK
ncbi:hypothetical protein [Methyloglobulus sp.]|uniref:hypothetical protein n=1 Tax=Methyloglobulus sp. TaxID=2518622 RepID=UPI0032B83665